VLILTARDGVEDRIAGLDAGADDYLVKPITIDELAARLRAMVRRSAGRAQAVWQHGDLEYDPAAKIVRWKGQRVELTGFELALLETLLKHPQRVLSKANLQEKLYDWSGTEPESNAIEVHIHHLRRKSIRHRAHGARRRFSSAARQRRHEPSRRLGLSAVCAPLASHLRVHQAGTAGGQQLFEN
jgi:DNA-binding response OmpR family regulator